MSQLTDLLNRAFENKGNKNRYTNGPWSIGFNERTYDTYFELYYNNVPVLNGNTLDKELQICNEHQYPLEKLIPDVEKALPEYKFDIKIEILMPFDFNGNWVYDVENAEYADTKENYVPPFGLSSDGYDVALFSINKLSDLDKVVLNRGAEGDFCIDDFTILLNHNDNNSIEITPTAYKSCVEPKAPLEEQITAAKEQKQPMAEHSSVSKEQER